MKINIAVLKKYINISVDTDALRDIMEDIGLEVKRTDTMSDEDVLTLELLANRGDHHSYFGIAREIHGRTKWSLYDIPVSVISAVQSTEKVMVQSDKCFTYTLSEFELRTTENTEYPEHLQKMLNTTGVNNGIVPIDITNTVNLEIGQPLHVFDADHVKGKIVVRESKPGENAMLLFREEATEIPEGTLVIADDENILAIAGVMGCEHAKVTEVTKRVYLESATFDPVSVRIAARGLNIQSDASTRFERGSDPAQAVDAVKRAKYLFENVGWENTGSVEISKQWNYPVAVIPFSTEKFNNYFGVKYTGRELRERLTRYGFACTDGNNKNSLFDTNVEVPTHRIWDIKEESDLFEELGRSIGYNAFPAVLPKNSVGIKIDEALSRKYKIEDVLIAQNFYEVFTDGFYGERNLKNLGIEEGHPLFQHVRTINSAESSYSFMKNNTLSQALDMVQANQHVKNNHLKVYEWSRTFYPNADAKNGLCDERQVLWMIVSGNATEKSWKKPGEAVDVFYMKGLVEEISDILDLKLEVIQTKNDNDLPPVGICLHPTRRGIVTHNGITIGLLGEVHPLVLKSSGIKNARPYFLELSQDILAIKPELREYVAPSNYLDIVRDVCLVLPKNAAAKDVIAAMKKHSAWITSAHVIDLFNSKETEGKDAVTFSIAYSLEKAGKDKLTTEQINSETEKLVDTVISDFQNENIAIRRRTEGK